VVARAVTEGLPPVCYNVKAIIFDIDGTLLDSVDAHARAWQEAFSEFGHIHSFGRIRSQIGKGGDQLMPVFLTNEEIEKEGEVIEKHRGAIFKKNYLPDLEPFPQVRDLFHRLLQDKWKLALASSAKKAELKIYKEMCHIADLLETETSSDEAEESKPHPDIFQAAMKRLGDIDPADCLVVGDSPYDAQAAGKAGIRSIGVLCGGFPEAELRQAGYETIYQDPADILAHYEESVFSRERP
jgi:HAD superfamily hydrolase (TIGR01509 family)